MLFGESTAILYVTTSRLRYKRIREDPATEISPLRPLIIPLLPSLPYSRMVVQGFFVASCVLAMTALAKPNFTPNHSVLQKRLAGQVVAFACYGGGGDCDCPVDLTGDNNGVLINVYPGYQCAYAGGACTWDDKVSDIALASHGSQRAS